MEIICRAFDGKEFIGLGACEECLAYESAIQNYPLAYDFNGEKTTNPDASLFVVIDNATELSTFLKHCEEKDSPCVGIDGTGCWLWDSYVSKYVKVDIVLRTIEGYLRDKNKEE